MPSGTYQLPNSNLPVSLDEFNAYNKKQAENVSILGGNTGSSSSVVGPGRGLTLKTMDENAINAEAQTQGAPTFSKWKGPERGFLTLLLRRTMRHSPMWARKRILRIKGCLKTSETSNLKRHKVDRFLLQNAWRVRALPNQELPLNARLRQILPLRNAPFLPGKRGRQSG
jgi:hypothetical protein